MNGTIKPSTYLEKQYLLQFSDANAEFINNEAAYVIFPSNYTLIQDGDKSIYLYVLLTGLVRGYYIDDSGNDITKCFSSENDFVCSEGLRTNGSASYTIECLEKCHCMRLPYDLLRYVMDKDAVFKNFVSGEYFKELGKLEKRSKDLVVLSAEERYFNFCEENPNLQGRVSLKHVASYIGIRPASLSRIRKNIKIVHLN